LRRDKGAVMELLTAKDVAKILKSSEHFVYKHFKKLGGFKIAGIVRFNKDKLDNYIKGVSESERVQTRKEMEV
jgi:hypothetical protein